MSRKIGWDSINLKPTERWGHTEYSMDYHLEYIKKLGKPLLEAWDFDFIWVTNDGLVDWAKSGMSTDMGHAEYAADGGDKRESVKCPFEDVEQVLSFDPEKTYGLPGFEGQDPAQTAVKMAERFKP